MKPFFVLTGPPGAGKSTALAHLRGDGVSIVEEPARRVIAQQRRIGGYGTSEQDPALFVQLMLARAMEDYDRHTEQGYTVLFDRGLPDLLAYADYYDLDPAPIRAACDLMPYAPTVFWMPSWREIYITDDERRMSFEAADAFGAGIARQYRGLGYRLLDVPFGSVAERAAFLRTRIRGGSTDL